MTFVLGSRSQGPARINFLVGVAPWASSEALLLVAPPPRGVEWWGGGAMVVAGAVPPTVVVMDVVPLLLLLLIPSGSLTGSNPDVLVPCKINKNAIKL